VKRSFVVARSEADCTGRMWNFGGSAIIPDRSPVVWMLGCVLYFNLFNSFTVSGGDSDLRPGTP